MNLELLTVVIIFTVIILTAFFTVVRSIAFLMGRKSKLDLRIVSMQILSFAVWISLFANIFIPKSKDASTPEFGMLVFGTSIVIGLFLIRSIFREIQVENSVEKLIKKIHQNNIKLKKLDKQKTEFLSLASHQLRSPLTSINGYISMILEKDFGEIPSHLVQPLNRIFESSNSLGILINDFLNVNKIEKGEMEYILEDFDIRKTIEIIFKEFEILAADKKLDFKLELPNEEIIVRGDINKTKQIISNLTDNSVKYTNEGFVKMSCRIIGDRARFEITDSGIGISKPTGEKIFKKFIRGEEAIKIDVSGTGLGLYVASIMTSAMGGRIWAESAGEGKGSTFFFEIPLSEKE